jgi:hypothetical protein
VSLIDLEIVCHLCSEGFVFSAGEQELQRVRGIERAPTRCSACMRRPPTVPWLPKITLSRAPKT